MGSQIRRPGPQLRGFVKISQNQSRTTELGLFLFLAPSLSTVPVPTRTLYGVSEFLCFTTQFADPDTRGTVRLIYNPKVHTLSGHDNIITHVRSSRLYSSYVVVLLPLIPFVYWDILQIHRSGIHQSRSE